MSRAPKNPPPGYICRCQTPFGGDMNAPRTRVSGIAERRIFKSYASLSAVPTDELQALVDLLKNHSGNPGPNHAGLLSPAVMAELARRNGAECPGRPRPDSPAR